MELKERIIIEVHSYEEVVHCGNLLKDPNAWWYLDTTWGINDLPHIHYILFNLSLANPSPEAFNFGHTSSRSFCLKQVYKILRPHELELYLETVKIKQEIGL